MADGWQGSTVRAILDNPRYTGYAFFGLRSAEAGDRLPRGSEGR
ncbi:recombinase family protein [Actinophytocola xinjiangensis]|nr:recombinase family protein [Actinophytocola xinjiangensis]